MKLSEALILRADLQKRVQELRGRLNASAVVQEGEQPPEDPQALLAELDRIFVQLTALIANINRTNLNVMLPNGMSLTDALARRDMLQLRMSVLRGAADAAASPADRYSRTEIRRVPTIDIAEVRRQADTLAQESRELDMAIQGINWAADLLE